MDADGTTRRSGPWPLLRKISAADALVRRGYVTESIPLYEDVLREVAPSVAADDSLPPVPSVEARHAGLERVRLLRLRVASALRTEHEGALRTWRRFTLRAQQVRAFVAIALAISLLVFGWSRFTRRDLAENAHWRASSAIAGASRDGVFQPLGPFGDLPNFFCHTDNEKDPYVDVDLGDLHTIDTVEISTRADCCPERRRGLELWLGPDSQHLTKSAVRAPGEEDRVWTVAARGARARVVRVALSGVHVLHLARVRVFGR
jgi:hypothetical protein